MAYTKNKSSLNKLVTVTKTNKFKIGGDKLSGISQIAGAAGKDIMGAINNAQGVKDFDNMKRRAAMPQVSAGYAGDSYDAIQSQLSSLVTGRTVTGEDLGTKSWGTMALEGLSEGLEGSAAGFSLGPIGAIVGGVVGTGTSLLGNLLGNRKRDRQAAQLTDIYRDAEQRDLGTLGVRIGNVGSTKLNNMNLGWNAYGGKLNRMNEFNKEGKKYKLRGPWSPEVLYWALNESDKYDYYVTVRKPKGTRTAGGGYNNTRFLKEAEKAYKAGKSTFKFEGNTYNTSTIYRKAVNIPKRVKEGTYTTTPTKQTTTQPTKAHSTTVKPKRNTTSSSKPLKIKGYDVSSATSELLNSLGSTINLFEGRVGNRPVFTNNKTNNAAIQPTKAHSTTVKPKRNTTSSSKPLKIKGYDVSSATSELLNSLGSTINLFEGRVGNRPVFTNNKTNNAAIQPTKAHSTTVKPKRNTTSSSKPLKIKGYDVSSATSELLNSLGSTINLFEGRVGNRPVFTNNKTNNAAIPTPPKLVVTAPAAKKINNNTNRTNSNAKKNTATAKEATTKQSSPNTVKANNTVSKPLSTTKRTAKRRSTPKVSKAIANPFDFTRESYINNLIETANNIANTDEGRNSLRAGNYFIPSKHAFGGELNTQGSDFTNGLLEINEGGTHEENPYEGVQSGVNEEGNPNLVEEGETIFNDFVFSNRLTIDEDIQNKYGLGGDITYAEASKKLAEESSERPNDPISITGLRYFMEDLAQSQENLKALQEAESNKFTIGGDKDKTSYPDLSVPSYVNLRIPYGVDIPNWLSVLQDTAASEMKNKTFLDREAEKEAMAMYVLGKRGYDHTDQDNIDKFIEKMGVLPLEEWEEAELLNEYTKPSIVTKDSVKDKVADTTKPVLSEEELIGIQSLMKAPIHGNIGQVLSDTAGITNKNNYSQADLVEAASRINTPRVGFNPIGNYMGYEPEDIYSILNILNGSANANLRAIAQNSGINRGMANAATLAAINNYQTQQGQAYRQAAEANLARRLQAETFNRQTNQINSQGMFEADRANQQAYMADREMGLKGIMQAAAMRDEERRANEAARSQNYSSLFQNIGNYGRQLFNLNMANSTYPYLIGADGKVKYDSSNWKKEPITGAYGGRKRRMKKGGKK